MSGRYAVSDFLFNKDTHSYTFNSVRVPSVTQILQAEGFTHPYRGNSAAGKGTRVHAATTAFDKMERQTFLPEAEQGYLMAYLKWMHETEIDARYAFIEKPFYNEELHFAGTPDRITKEGLIIDIKTGLKEPAHALQLAGYALLIGADFVPMMALYLHSDGTYEEIFVTDREALPIFENAVRNYHWKKRNGIK